jgi:hypothetical protein
MSFFYKLLKKTWVLNLKKIEACSIGSCKESIVNKDLLLDD